MSSCCFIRIIIAVMEKRTTDTDRLLKNQAVNDIIIMENRARRLVLCLQERAKRSLLCAALPRNI